MVGIELPTQSGVAALVAALTISPYKFMDAAAGDTVRVGAAVSRPPEQRSCMRAFAPVYDVLEAKGCSNDNIIQKHGGTTLRPTTTVRFGQSSGRMALLGMFAFGVNGVVTKLVSFEPGKAADTDEELRNNLCVAAGVRPETNAL